MYEYKQSDVFDFAVFVGAETHEKGGELFFKYCPHCNGGGKDTDTFSINLESGVFKCFRASCDYHGHFVELARDFGFKLEQEQTRYKKLPQKTIESKPKAIQFLESRGISADVCRRYNITTQKDNENILVFPFYDEQGIMQFIKYRKTDFVKGKDKCKEWCEKDTKPILFGMAQCEDFTRLVITEGQMDSLSVAECGIKNAVSVPTGAVGFTWLSHCWDWVNKFNEIVVFGDNENGKITLIETLEKRIQGKVKCVRPEDYLCEKDANDILRKYGKEAVIKAVENAQLREVKYVKRLANVEAVNLSELPKIKTGIRNLDRACGGLLMGHITLLSGKRGEGKSTLMSQFVAQAIDQGNAVFVYSGELPNYHFKNWLDLQIAGNKNIQTRTNEYGDNEYYLLPNTVEKINEWYYDKAYIFDNSSVTDDEYEGLLKVMVDAICRYDIKLVCIDNLMTAMESDANTDLYRQQSTFVKNLEKLAQQYDVAIVLVAHPKKTQGDFDNDTVSGSSDITNAVSFVLNYQRAKDDESCDSKLMITKNRMNGKLLTGENSIKLYYSEKSKRILSNELENIDYGCFKVEEDFSDLDEISF
jgi:twinkle protein